jgi:predicted outer membrane repeat protein
MHHKIMRTTARAAAIGAVIVLGSTAVAQGAMAKPTPSGIVTVPCNTPALIAALSDPSSGDTLRLAFGCTYLLLAPLPDIDTNLTIMGNGATLERTVNGDNNFTILTVEGGDVNLVRLSFRNGGGENDEDGGAIYNDGGNITVLAGTFTDNNGEYGGAIYNDDGTLTMTSAYFVNNYSYEGGGAIYNDDTMTLRSSHFSGNQSYSGGAIYNDDTATIIGTTFTRNGGYSYEGGALYNDEQATLSSVTIRGNYAEWGGGIYNDDTLAVASSTIAGNSASSGGGGIYNDDTATVTRTNVSGNTPDNCEGDVIAGCFG